MKTESQFLSYPEFLNDEDFSTKILGGKGYQLVQLKKWQQSVPDFGVISSSEYSNWKKYQTLKVDTIHAIFDTVINKWGNSLVSVRSSLDGEDSLNASFAGILTTYLYVRPEEILEKIYLCYKNIQSERFEKYLEVNSKIQLNEINFAIVIQKMIDPVVSGVAFSRSPIGDSTLSKIDAGPGVGEGIVSGNVEVESYSMNRFSEILDIRYIDDTSEKNDCTILLKEELIFINEKLMELEGKLGGPSDIEWAICKDERKFYVLQIRPITQSFSEIEYFIDTNLSESYPSVTSPMTGSFVKLAYSEVYQEIGQLFLYRKKSKIKFQSVCSNLISYIEGHLYYHVKSYYQLLHFLPGKDKNIESWHKMIGGKSLLNNFSEETKTFEKINPLEKILFFSQMFEIFLFHSKIFKKLCSRWMNQIKNHEKKFNDLEPEILILKLEKLLKSTKGFGLTALNDYFIMIGQRILNFYFKKYHIDEKYFLDSLKTKMGVESLKPEEAINELVLKLKNEPQYFHHLQKFFGEENINLMNRDPILGDPYDPIWKKLHEEDLVGLIKILKDFLEQYGSRSFEELKLESLTLQNSPKLFFQLIQMKSMNPEVVKIKNIPTDQSNSLSIFETIKFKGFDKFIFKFTMNKTRNYIEMREKTRLVRGKYYGAIRNSLTKIFIALRENSKNELKEFYYLDFYSLTYPELLDFSQGKLTYSDLKNLILKRKEWLELKNKFEFPEMLTLSSDEIPSKLNMEQFWSEKINRTLNQNQIQLENEFVGIGAGSGIVEGEILNISEPSQAFNLTPSELKNKILVTKNTDPAWVYIMSQCQGLVSERGSLLSHTSIIGRELQIPTVVSVKGICQKLKEQNALKIRIDGSSGLIQIID
jgi:phosphohistidine swiveling domain-containing protein